MLNLFYNLQKQTQVPPGGGVAVVPKFAFADYIEATLTVYASGTTPMDLSGVASWRGAVDVDTKKETEPLVRLMPEAFDATDAASGKLAFPIDCNTANFQTAVKSGATGYLEIYGHDAEDRQIVRIRIAATLLPAVDPPGDPEPDEVPPSAVRTLNGLSGNVVIKTAAGEALAAADGVVTLPEIEPGTSINGLTGVVVLVDSNGNPLAVDENTIVIPGGDVTAAGDNAFTGANTFDGAVVCNSTLTVTVPTDAADSISIANAAAAGYSRMLFSVPGLSITSGLGGASAGIEALRNRWYVYNLTTSTVLLTVSATGDMAITGALTVGERTVSGLYPDRNPVAQVPVLDAALGVCHYLDATFTEIDFSYPVWHLVEIRALVCSVNAAITGTVEITPYVDGVAQTPVTINVGATWAAVTIPLAVETGSIRLVRTGGTLADGGWVTAAFRGITAMVTI